MIIIGEPGVENSFVGPAGPYMNINKVTQSQD